MGLHFTYNAAFSNASQGTIAGSTLGVRDQVRLLIRDTGIASGSGSSSTTKAFLMADEEIDFVQTQEANVYMMAARCAKTLGAAPGSIASRHIGDLSVTYDPRVYAALAVDLEARGMTYQQPYVGGVSEADKLAQQADADWIPTRAFTGAFDNPNAPQPVAGASTNPLTRGY